jgi:hypothetical protein
MLHQVRGSFRLHEGPHLDRSEAVKQGPAPQKVLVGVRGVVILIIYVTYLSVPVRNIRAPGPGAQERSQHHWTEAPFCPPDSPTVPWGGAHVELPLPACRLERVRAWRHYDGGPHHPRTGAGHKR